MSWRTSAFAPRVEYMAPSSIHHIYADSTSAWTSTDFRLSEPEVDRTVTELTSSAGGLVQAAHHLKIQIVEKDGNWFALNSAQLELCRRLEKGGVCPKVRVDIVPSDEVPLNVRDLMTLPVTCTSGDEKRTPNATATQKSVKSSSAAVATGGGGAMKGYQQLGQDEKETDDDDDEEEEEEQEEEEAEEEDKSPSEDDEDDAFGDTDDGSSADIVSDSDLEWSDEEVDSSEGEWSNVDERSSGSCSHAAQLSSDDEKNCLL